MLCIICRLSCCIHGQQRELSSVKIKRMFVNRSNRFNASNDPLVDWNNNNYVNIRIFCILNCICVPNTCIATATTSTLLPELIDFSFFSLLFEWEKNAIQIECIAKYIALICHKLIVNWQFWSDLLHNLKLLSRSSLRSFHCIITSYWNESRAHGLHLWIHAINTFWPYHIAAIIDIISFLSFDFYECSSFINVSLLK